MPRYALLVITLAACNSREPMSRQAPPGSPPFLGPIPTDFRSTASPAAFQAATTGSADQLGRTRAALALTDGEGLPLAPPQPGEGGLVELESCDALRAVFGGFLLRSQVAPGSTANTVQVPDAQALTGQDCDTALASAGVTFPGLVQGLRNQAANLAHLTLAADGCTTLSPALRRPALAAVGYDFQRVAGGSLDPKRWSLLNATFEGGADGRRLALRAEVEASARSTPPAGSPADSVFGTYQWAAVATLVDQDAQTSTSTKAEEVAVSVSKGNQGNRNAVLTRLAQVTVHHGAQESIDEVTTYKVDDSDAPVRWWTVTVAASPAAAGGMDVDVNIKTPGGGDTANKLTLAPVAGGGCRALAR